MLASEGFNGRWCAPIRVSFSQDGVYRAAEHLAVACTHFLVRFCLRIFWKVGEVIAQSLQFGDSRLELRYGGADIGQLDDVGVRLVRQLGKLGQVIVYYFIGIQLVSKACKNAPCERDVTCFDGYISGGGKGFYNWQKRVGGQRRGFVGEGVDNLRAGGHVELTLSC